MGALRGGAAAAAAALRRATRARPPRIASLGPTAAAARARGGEARAGAPQRRAAVAAVGAGVGVPEPKRYSISAEGVRGQTASTTDTGHVLRTDLPKAMVRASGRAPVLSGACTRALERWGRRRVTC